MGSAPAKIGEDVGCAIRFRDVSGLRTRTEHLTGVAMLGRFTAIESLRHTLATDVLFGLAQRWRPELRVVVASATIDAERVQQIFATRRR